MTNERCTEILQSIKFLLSSEQYSDVVEEALDKAINVMGRSKSNIMFKVPYGQDPYNAIGEYIRNHITVIEDIIAVIEIDGSIINTLFSVDTDEYGYFTWYTDWYEGEKNVVLIDFFPVSEATKPIVKPEIIMCKDCKHRGETPIADGRYWCDIHGAFMYYCSDAERRTDESN